MPFILCFIIFFFSPLPFWNFNTSLRASHPLYPLFLSRHLRSLSSKAVCRSDIRGVFFFVRDAGRSRRKRRHLIRCGSLCSFFLLRQATPRLLIMKTDWFVLCINFHLFFWLNNTYLYKVACLILLAFVMEKSYHCVQFINIMLRVFFPLLQL